MPFEFDKGQKTDSENEVQGPASYDPSSRPTVTLTDVVNIDGTTDVDASALQSNPTDALVAEPESVSNNVVGVGLYRVQDPATTSGDESTLNEVDSGDDVSGFNIRVSGRGY